LALPIATEPFKAISRRLGEVLHVLHVLDLSELTKGDALHGREPAAVESSEDPLCLPVSE
jgi:hypothetical protein